MNDSYLRFPQQSGELVTFVAEDEVWLAAANGGRAWRVTSDAVPVSTPRISPDGTGLAWVSWQDAMPEVHVTGVDGGVGRRLTYWGDNRTTLLGWSGEDAVLVASSAGTSSDRRTWAHRVPLDGGPAQRLPYGPVGGLAPGADGAVLLSSPLMREPAHWKRYRGGTIGKLWLDPDGSGEFHRILTELDGNLNCPMWLGERIAFCSDHDGVGHVYSCLPDGTDLRRHSNGEFYSRQATSDGQRIVYQEAGTIHRLAGPDAEPERVEINLAGTRTARQPYPMTAADRFGGFATDKSGSASVIEVRGTAHWLTHRDGPARVLADDPGVRIRSPRVLGDTGQAVFVTDADGEDALEIVSSDGRSGEPRRIGTGDLGRMHELEVSPDGKLLAVTSHDGRLLLVHTDGGEPREVVRAQTGRPHSPAFSPDSRWLAWAHPGTVPLSQIKLCSTDDLSTVDVTELRFADDEPVFTSDGKYLAFLSVRTFDPVYDSHVFDVFFPAACRPYLVPLAALTPSPFAPQPAGRPFGADKPGGEDSGENGESKEPPRTEVDTEGLAERITPFPVPAADYYDLRAARGAMLWRRSPESGVLGDAAAGPDADPERPALERFDFEKRRAETFLEGVSGYDVSGDGKRLVVQDKQRLRALPSDRKPDGDGDGKPDDVDIDLSRARITVYPEAEWVQEYQEAGRLMRDNFWRADMGGVDWPAVLARYRPLVDAIGSHDDLIDLLWEVQGELGTSHAYAIPPGGDGDHHRKVGLLGADIDRDADGVWRVERVLPSDTSRPDARSPLAAPGVAVRAGDALLAVDGRAVDPVSGPAPLLVGAAGKAVELTVAPADGSPSRRVVVLPLSDDKPLRYQAWVADRRDYVHRISGGRVGYLHVPDMIASGWAQLHRDLRQEVLCEALIADVRENRGGHLSQLVVEKLARRVIGWTVSRDSNLVRTYPADAPRGPVVAVANEFSGSDGDIVNAAIKALGVAPVVGTRTWGGTIGIDMRYRLVDGTLVTQPKYASWMTGPGWGVENHGIDPDVEVVMTPQDWGAGSDPQLDTAVRIALERLEEQPAATPPEIPPLPAGGERT